jgi:Protein of unknown function (DUF3047)
MFRKKLLILLALFTTTGLVVSAAELPVGRFSSGDLVGWEPKVFKGETAYALIRENGRTVLKAHSRHAASGLVRKLEIDPREYPRLRWSWKVEHTLHREDATKKSGDDFAARVYVVFPRTFFWQTRAINYVWSARMAKNSHVPNPYTANSVTVAVESGDDKAGQWLAEERNIYEDYRNFFGEEPPKLGAVAVMTDTDNTGDEVTAWYGDIFLESGR